MEKDLNLELRKEIIEIALTLEGAINNLLISYLNIDSLNLKALGNKNSSISFKNKIDLLADIEVLNKDEHFKFLILMEFRNQFLHNANCNSFEKAVEILGTDRGKQLLKYNDVTFNANLETIYKHSYQRMYIECLDIVLKKYEDKHKIVQTRRKTITDVAEYGKYIIDKDTEVFDIIAKQCEPNKNDTKDLIDFKMRVFSTMHQFTTSMIQNDSYIDLKKKIENLFDTEKKIQAFFK